MGQAFPTVTLQDAVVRLEPLSLIHVPGLLIAATEDRKHFSLTPIPFDEASMTEYVEAALGEAADGTQLPFATVRQSDQRIVGSTRFGDLAIWSWVPGATKQRIDRPDVAEIGWTWLAGSAQRTSVNTSAKLLMLTYAFEEWDVHRVRIRTDRRNARSRAAIERLGATLDGVLRGDRPSPDGSVRDSAVYSIVASEWPSIKADLIDKVESTSTRS
jgi:N-acetyltransferase